MSELLQHNFQGTILEFHLEYAHRSTILQWTYVTISIERKVKLMLYHHLSSCATHWQHHRHREWVHQVPVLDMHAWWQLADNPIARIKFRRDSRRLVELSLGANVVAPFQMDMIKSEINWIIINAIKFETILIDVWQKTLKINSSFLMKNKNLPDLLVFRYSSQATT